MEKNEPDKTYAKTIPGASANASGPEEMMDLITMIREMPRVAPPLGLLPSVMEAVRTKRIPLWLRVYRRIS